MDTSIKRSAVLKEEKNISIGGTNITIVDFDPKEHELNFRCLKKIRLNRADMKLIGINLVYILILNAVLAGASFGIMYLLNLRIGGDIIIP